MLVASVVSAATPKYVFYFIGDGMGMGHVMAAQSYNREVLKSDELLLMMDDFALNEYTNNIPAKPYVIEKLKELKEKGYSLNIFTACQHNLLTPCLKRLGIYHWFDTVISCEEDMNVNKKVPEAYYKLAEKLHTVCENCVFFDDNIEAISASRNTGMETVGVFDETSAAWEKSIRDIADKYIYTFEEI